MSKHSVTFFVTLSQAKGLQDCSVATLPLDDTW